MKTNVGNFRLVGLGDKSVCISSTILVDGSKSAIHDREQTLDQTILVDINKKLGITVVTIIIRYPVYKHCDKVAT